MRDPDLRLLVAAYYFPPSNVVGAQRVSKFVKYLLRMGVEIDVVAADPRYYGAAVDARIPDYLSGPGVRVLRTQAVRARGPIKEEGLYWLPYLVPTLLRLSRERRYDAFFITGNPFMSFLAAPILKRLRGVPYILDFRDPWSMSPYRRRTVLNTGLAQMIRSIEKTAVRSADVVLNVTDDASHLYIDHYSKRGVPKDRFQTIMNGVDLEDLANVEPVQPLAAFSLVYSGKFGGFRDPRPLLEAVRRLCSEERLDPAQFRLTHVGEAESGLMDSANTLG